jgi:hypothetical protein
MLAEVATIVTPETLMAWHRSLIAQKYDGRSKRGSGRPRTAGEIEAWVLGMSEENRDWGDRRIEGAWSNLGHELARSTIAQILERHGIDPAPERSRKTTRKEFLPALGADCGQRFLLGSGDQARSATIYHFVLHRLVYAEGGDRRHRAGGERIVDEPDRPESHGLRGRNPDWKTVPDSRPQRLPLSS